MSPTNVRLPESMIDDSPTTVAEAGRPHPTRRRSPAAVAETLGLAVRDVEAVLAYRAECRDEIDDLIEHHHRAQDEALAAWERRRALDAT